MRQDLAMGGCVGWLLAESCGVCMPLMLERAGGLGHMRVRGFLNIDAGIRVFAGK